jgi:hypothetical protein
MLLEKGATDVADWHPIMQAQEYEPGRWVMIDTSGKPYGFVEFVRRGGEVGYRARRWAQNVQDQSVIGYYRNLRAAAKATVIAKQSHLTVDVRGASGWSAQPSPHERAPGKANTPPRTERD